MGAVCAPLDRRELAVHSNFLRSVEASWTLWERWVDAYTVFLDVFLGDPTAR